MIPSEQGWTDIFAASTTNAWQSGVGLLDEWAFHQWARAEGYREAARSLAETAQESLDPTASDRLVFPVVFLYRHAIELKLKELIARGEEYLGREPSNQLTHDLAQLWNLAEAIIEACPVGQTQPYRSACGEVIRSLHSIDRGGTAFRYATDRQGHRSLPDDLRLIDAVHFANRMDDVFDVLDGWLTGIYESTTWSEYAREEVPDDWNQP